MAVSYPSCLGVICVIDRKQQAIYSCGKTGRKIMSNLDERIRLARTQAESIKTAVHRQIATSLVADMDFTMDHSWIAGALPTENVRVHHRAPHTFDEALRTVESMATSAYVAQNLADQAKKLAQFVLNGGDPEALRDVAEGVMILTEDPKFSKGATS
jgi:hypothetical protein